MSVRQVHALCAQVEQTLDEEKFERILVVGCGDGNEAVTLADRFGAEVTGIDVESGFDADAAERVDLRVMDATAMTFDDDTFDLIYSFHALEHIAEPERALDEMRRVLKPGGGYCIGTPNRNRVLGYIGSSTTLANKIRWNVADIGMRLRGRFRNEYGAHAGFTSEELGQACEAAFGQAVAVADGYYRTLYATGRAGRAIDRIAGTPIARYVFPCVYFCGRRVTPSG